MIKISKLKPVLTPDVFFNLDKVLMVNTIRIDRRDTYVASLVQDHPNCFTHQGELYILVVMVGQPQNLFLNARRGLPIKLRDVTALVQWDGNLISALADHRIYDLSAYSNIPNASLSVANEPALFIEKYIQPFQGPAGEARGPRRKPSLIF